MPDTAFKAFPLDNPDAEAVLEPLRHATLGRMGEWLRKRPRIPGWAISEIASRIARASTAEELVELEGEILNWIE
jgi:hypothetical protein